MSSLPTRMKLIYTKMKELEWSQDVFHYKSIGIFQDAQGQLTPQSLFEFGPNPNLSKILWLSSLPASMKNIPSKMKALACSQQIPIITLWELSIAMDARVLIRSGPKPNASFPLPNYASDKIWLQLTNWSQ